jgi:hypothetical protein
MKLTAKEAAAPAKEVSDILSVIVRLILMNNVAELASSCTTPNIPRKTAKGILRWI